MNVTEPRGTRESSDKNYFKMRIVLTMAAFVCCCFVNGAYAQTVFKGKVIDSQTGKPVQDANVRLLQTTIGCATNSKGEFILQDVPDGTYKMRVSALNYSSSILEYSYIGPKTELLFAISVFPLFIFTVEVNIF